MESINLSEFDKLQNLVQIGFDNVTKSQSSLREQELKDGAYQGVCTLCTKPVFQSNGVKAENNLFCNSCFVCQDCCQPLSSSYFMIYDSNSNGNPLETFIKELSSGSDAGLKIPVRCGSCQDKLIHSKSWGTCTGCDQPFSAIEQKLTISLNTSDPESEVMFYHPQCFKCTTCQVPIASGKYYASPAVTDEQVAASQNILLFTPLCEGCYLKTLPKCAHCNEAIAGSGENSVFVTINDLNYHSSCVVCNVCSKHIAPSEDIFTNPKQKDSSIYCSQDCFKKSSST